MDDLGGFPIIFGNTQLVYNTYLRDVSNLLIYEWNNPLILNRYPKLFLETPEQAAKVALRRFRLDWFFNEEQLKGVAPDAAFRNAAWQFCRGNKTRPKWDYRPYIPRFGSKVMAFLHLFSGERRTGDLHTALENLRAPDSCVLLVIFSWISFLTHRLATWHVGKARRNGWSSCLRGASQASSQDHPARRGQGPDPEEESQDLAEETGVRVPSDTSINHRVWDNSRWRRQSN